MKNYIDKGFDMAQAEALEYAYKYLGLSAQEMECVARKEYPASLMYSIIEIFENNEGEDVVDYFKENFEPYINLDKFSVDQIGIIFDGLEDGLTPKEVDLYAKPEFTDLQMEVIMDGLVYGLSTYEVSQYADSKLSPEEMEEKMNSLLNN